MTSNVLPSKRCFGPFSTAVERVGWVVPSHVKRCCNPKHERHFVDTRTGVILTCGGPFVLGRAPGPSHHVRCVPHGHVVNKQTGEVIG